MDRVRTMLAVNCDVVLCIEPSDTISAWAPQRKTRFAAFPLCLAGSAQGGSAVQGQVGEKQKEKADRLVCFPFCVLRSERQPIHLIEASNPQENILDCSCYS